MFIEFIVIYTFIVIFIQFLFIAIYAFVEIFIKFFR